MDHDYHGAPELSETNANCQVKYMNQARLNLETQKQTSASPQRQEKITINWHEDMDAALVSINKHG